MNAIAVLMRYEHRPLPGHPSGCDLFPEGVRAPALLNTLTRCCDEQNAFMCVRSGVEWQPLICCTPSVIGTGTERKDACSCKAFILEFSSRVDHVPRVAGWWAIPTLSLPSSKSTCKLQRAKTYDLAENYFTREKRATRQALLQQERRHPFLWKWALGADVPWFGGRSAHL